MALSSIGEAVITVGADTAKFAKDLYAQSKALGADFGKNFSDALGKEGTKGLKDFGSTINETLSSPKLLAGVSLGPALLPAISAATVGIIGLGGALAGAGAALGVFGAVAGTAFTEMQEQAEELEKLKTKAEQYGDAAKLAQASGDTAAQTAALKNQKIALDQIKFALAAMPPEQRKAYDGYKALGGAWQSFVADNSPATYGILAQGFGLLKDNIGALQPLFDVGANAAKGFLDAAGRWADSGGLKGLIDYLSVNAAQALPTLGNILANLGGAFGNLFQTVGGGPGQGILTWLEQITQRFQDFTGSGAFLQWVGQTKSQLPQLVSVLGNFATSAATIATALTPLAPISLAIAGALTQLIAALPPGVIQAIVAGIVAYNIAMKTYAVVTALAAVKTAILGTAETAGLAARLASTGAWIANTAAKVANTVATGAWTIAAGIATVATTVWGAATTALAVAMAIVTSPITLVIVGIVALVAVIVLIATKTTWFQTLWSVAWKAIQFVFKAVVDSIKGIWDTLWSGILAVINAAIFVIKAYITLYKTIFTAALHATEAVAKAVWKGIQTAAGVAFSTIRTVISNVFSAVKAAFNALKSAGIAVWNALKSSASASFNALKSAGSAAASKIKSVLTNAINLVKTAFSRGVSEIKGKFDEIKQKVLSINLFDAGAKLIQTLISGITSKIGAVGDAMGNVASKIKGYLPGSPVKEGALTSWNNGGAGKRLTAMLAEGITAGSGQVVAATSKMSADVANAAGAAQGRLIKAQLSAAKQRVSNVKADAAQLAAGKYSGIPLELRRKFIAADRIRAASGKKTTSTSSSGATSGALADYGSGGGDTYNITLNVAARNLADLEAVRKLAVSLADARANARKTLRSGKVKS